jgi:putative transposase
MTYAFIDEHRDQYPVRTLCDVLDVSASGYYDWEDRDASAQVTRRAGLLTEIKRIHAEHHGRYGSPRIHAQLATEGKLASRGLIEKLMADNDIHAIAKRKFRPATTDSKHDLPVAQNLLERNFRAFRPNEKWVADITYIPTDEGFIYLAAVMDLCTRKIVGWSMRDHIRTELTLAALMMAVQLQQSGAGLIHHSDPRFREDGSQYAAGDYAAKLADYGIRQSMSRKGDCWGPKVTRLRGKMRPWKASSTRSKQNTSITRSSKQKTMRIWPCSTTSTYTTTENACTQASAISRHASWN